ncbi:MAG: hypothetical protein H6621_11555 [Halobacteriovoraceae bacterium]|nr:hypothetical protein [Halobacteriovoraceae bacterium]MCB9095695.1 hypothetical protein [Halobacteriovoraceae bacterium]
MFKQFFLFLGISLFPSLSFSSNPQCHLSEPVISLSGPVSFVLKELNLSHDKHWMAASHQHHFLDSQFKGKKLGGGVYISMKEFQKIKKKSVVFFDESYELKERLQYIQKQNPNISKLVEIKTRGLTPFSAYIEVFKNIYPFLNQCDEGRKKLDKWVKSIEDESKNINFKHDTILFYLGSLQSKNNLMMVNDGFSLAWIKKKKYQPYPSDLHYVSPSQKVLSKLKGKVLEIGLVEKKGAGFKPIALGKNKYDIQISYLLIPGIPQIQFMHFFHSWYLANDEQF